MPKPETVKRLERKLRRSNAGILTDAEVRLGTAEIKRLLGWEATELLQGSRIRSQDTVRWSSLKTRCEQARAERGLTLKEAAGALKVPRYRLEAVEAGRLAELKPEIAHRYFSLLGIESWVKRWLRANPGLARRTGLVQQRPGRAKARTNSRGHNQALAPGGVWRPQNS